ncbi:MAG: cytochrome C oxidase subunit IV family protein [Verrucomicrobiales bacterium]|nr:cytochrome C oxidase subunit IV family protein [Verrucomicrobiales bacterium]
MADSHDSPDFLQYLIKLFYMVGGVLVAGTLITVIIDVSFEMPLGMAAIIGLSIALVKAGFVVAIFMHYKWDKKLIMITWTMILTFFFFAGMMGLIMWAEKDIPELYGKQPDAIYPILAALLGLILPASFTVLTVKLLNQPAAVEAEPTPRPKAKAKRTTRKKKES